MAILLILWAQLALAAGPTECVLDVTKVRTIQNGTEKLVYQHADWKKHPTLSVTSREMTIAGLRELGLVRRSHACRRLHFNMSFEDCLKQKVRFIDLHFNPTSREALHHAHEKMSGHSIRDKMAAGLRDRRQLLATVLADNADVPTIYHYVFGSEFLSWLT